MRASRTHAGVSNAHVRPPFFATSWASTLRALIGKYKTFIGASFYVVVAASATFRHFFRYTRVFVRTAGTRGCFIGHSAPHTPLCSWSRFAKCAEMSNRPNIDEGVPQSPSPSRAPRTVGPPHHDMRAKWKKKRTRRLKRKRRKMRQRSK